MTKDEISEMKQMDAHVPSEIRKCRAAARCSLYNPITSQAELGLSQPIDPIEQQEAEKK